MQGGKWICLDPGEGGRDAVHDVVGDEEYILVMLPDGSQLVRPMFKYGIDILLLKNEFHIGRLDCLSLSAETLRQN